MSRGFGLNPNWRYASRNVKFWKIDYRMVYFLILFLLNMSKNTLYMVGAIALFLWIVEARFGYRVEAVFRRLSCFIAGKYKPTVSPRRKNRTDR